MQIREWQLKLVFIVCFALVCFVALIPSAKPAWPKDSDIIKFKLEFVQEIRKVLKTETTYITAKAKINNWLVENKNKYGTVNYDVSCEYQVGDAYLLCYQINYSGTDLQQINVIRRDDKSIDIKYGPIE